MQASSQFGHHQCSFPVSVYHRVTVHNGYKVMTLAVSLLCLSFLFRVGRCSLRSAELGAFGIGVWPSLAPGSIVHIDVVVVIDCLDKRLPGLTRASRFSVVRI